ncbi:3'-5' exonuclease [Roseomonas terrae]|jgi:predicted PolB exonuclease-like 3'-5' exonuclease|uniref:3'-5' exonuclease n=1 Tax=Neoroseomonas terrae TaxID=424799 RepID=A0ABS5EPH3_9PROT|nr:3'-5' exonuclease [Neoroseomonas terrae]MBR0652937.1 3'-5' exonuclease [Neoroseomonas terrae]
MERVVVFDIETVPDLAAGRALLGEEAEGLADASLRVTLGARYARDGQDPATAFLKPPLHAIACLALLVAERDGAEEPWRVRRMASRHTGETPEAEILALFERTLAQRPAPMLAGFNTSGFDLPILRYRAIATGVAMPSLNGGNGRDYGYRYGRDHLDLADRLSGFRASPMPSLAEACALLGLTAKAGMNGAEVEPAMAAGRGDEVAAYCETDVAATWLLLLRYWQATGALPADAARHSFSAFAAFLEEQRAEPHLADHAEAALRLTAP